MGPLTLAFQPTYHDRPSLLLDLSVSAVDGAAAAVVGVRRCGRPGRPAGDAHARAGGLGALLLPLGPGAAARPTSQQQVVAGVAMEEISMVSDGAAAPESSAGSSSGVGVGREETKGKGTARGRGSRKASRPRFAFQTKSEKDVLDNGYRWRKYGQKAVKNNAFPV
ncbi:putative WRKY transcription factor 56 [Hordeum vulgare]|nr:putative WRKY transcription factor 56 [Hordeum vulgare]